MNRYLLPLFAAAGLFAQNAHNPTWWAKYEYLKSHGTAGNSSNSGSTIAGANTDASNECGPQSETYVAINPAAANQVAGGSNEIFRNPMRGYYSVDGGSTWGGVDLPLPPAKGAQGSTFGSDPSLAFDGSGNAYYSYIVVFVGSGNGINATELAVAKSTDGGRTYPSATFFNFSGGNDHFNDKPMIATDANPASPYRDSVYVAWDAASGGSTGGGVLVARSRDGGATFQVTRVDNPSGPGRAIGAVPFVGPNGEVYVAWNDYAANTIAFNKSLDGGATWGTPAVVSAKSLAFDYALPAESFRRALVYPSCAADLSTGTNRGTLHCSWMDLNPDGVTANIFYSRSRDGAAWSSPVAVTDSLGFPVDRFNQWLAVDPTNGDVNVSFYDTRNDKTGSRYQTDIYFTRLAKGTGKWLSPNVRVSGQSSNEHDCNGVYPCNAIDYGNQYGDYSGIASYGGISIPIWTDSRRNQNACSTGLVMEEVFTATVR